MKYSELDLNEEEVTKVLKYQENLFLDMKSKRIQPAKLSESVSSFANTSGGDICVGIEEKRTKGLSFFSWEGFNDIEETSAIILMLKNLAPLDNYYDVSFLKHPKLGSYVMQITIFKTQAVIFSTSGMAYVRKGAQKLPINTPEKLKRLELDKGIVQFENEIVNESSCEDILESDIYLEFMKSVVPNVDSEKWLKKQKLIRDNKIIVAGILLFDEEPQVLLPKRSAIKIFRYKTSGTADRAMLEGQPLTIEGCLYDQIYGAVNTTKKIIDSMKKLGDKFENVNYPEETLHEIITNAVIHRDYSIITDIQIRIFDNRIEVESPGKLPGHVTVKNILDEQSARNPKIVRLLNKFPNAPNKDVGEGLNTAFEAMTKLRLRTPIINEMDNKVMVEIRHERLASHFSEQMSQKL